MVTNGTSPRFSVGCGAAEERGSFHFRTADYRKDRADRTDYNDESSPAANRPGRWKRPVFSGGGTPEKPFGLEGPKIPLFFTPLGGKNPIL
jgi:hypothetical protein